MSLAVMFQHHGMRREVPLTKRAQLATVAHYKQQVGADAVKRNACSHLAAREHSQQRHTEGGWGYGWVAPIVTIQTYWGTRRTCTCDGRGDAHLLSQRELKEMNFPANNKKHQRKAFTLTHISWPQVQFRPF